MRSFCRKTSIHKIPRFRGGGGNLGLGGGGEVPIFYFYGRGDFSESRERKISPKFFRPKFFHGRPRVMSVPKCLCPRIWSARTKISAGCPQGRPAENFLFRLTFRF